MLLFGQDRSQWAVNRELLTISIFKVRRKPLKNVESILKSRDITLPTKVHLVPGREAALCWASLPKPGPASSVRAREGAGCGSVGAVSGA